MTRDEHLLTIAAEECNELAQRLTKALRFGRSETQPGHTENNEQRIVGEFTDLLAAMEMAGFPLGVVNGRALDAKVAKVEKFLRYSAECGTLA